MGVVVVGLGLGLGYARPRKCGPWFRPARISSLMSSEWDGTWLLLLLPLAVALVVPAFVVEVAWAQQQ